MTINEKSQLARNHVLVVADLIKLTTLDDITTKWLGAAD